MPVSVPPDFHTYWSSRTSTTGSLKGPVPMDRGPLHCHSEV